MMRTHFGIAWLAWLAVPCCLACAACSDSAGAKNTTSDGGPLGNGDGGLSGDAGIDRSLFSTGTELRIPVPESGSVFVHLDPPSVVQVAGDPKASADWDLAFEGFDIHTNSGPSGSNKGGSFGPLDAPSYNATPAPAIPFMFADTTGGAFVKWYAYDSETHVLYSRYHVIGVQDGSRRWKVQVENYYGERDGAPVSALYKIRYAELFADHAGDAVEVTNLDGTAGGTGADPTKPSECLDFGSGARTLLTPDAARSSSAWHVCFRRDAIGVNGELGGPRGIGGIDFDDAKTANETLAQVKARTADSEKAPFDAITYASFDGKTLRGDRIVSAFGDAWIDTKASPLTPAYSAWVLADASGTKKYFIGFTGFEDPTAKSPGTVVARIKPFK